MDKTLRTVLILSLVLISFSIAYYFLVFLPKMDFDLKQQNLVENQIKCSKAGKDYEMKDEQINSQSALYTAIDTAEYVFSQDLGTCLYREEMSTFINGNLLNNQFNIIDVYSNKVLFNWYRHYDNKGEVNDERGADEYTAAVTKYFTP